MIASGKAIRHSEEQNQYLNSNQNGQRRVVIDKLKIQYKCPYQKKPHHYEVNYLVSIFFVLLIASCIVFGYRYIRMAQKQQQIEQNQSLQNQLEAFESGKIMKLVQDKKQLQKQISQIQFQKSLQNHNRQYIVDKNKNQFEQTDLNRKQHFVQQEVQNTQNQAKRLQTPEIIEQQQKQILQDNPKVQLPQHQQNSDSQKTQQLYPMDDKAKKFIQTTNIQKLQQTLKSENNFLPISIQKKPSKFVQPSQKDLYDPIIKVRQQMQAKFNSKFQDLIYIKAGTNITQQQYYSAKDRMHLWKYINAKTKKVQFLQQVSYQDNSPIANSQNKQFSLQNIQKIILQQQLQYQKKYRVSQYQEIGFCIIVPSYKNVDKYFRNLNSIMQQNYQNFHIVFIDDASGDGTSQKVRKYMQKYQISQKKIELIENKVNKRALPNIDHAARRLCNSGQIMAIIDGDDYLIGTQVFKLINAQYQHKNLLALYTNHIRIHEPLYLKVGTCIDYPQRVKKMRTYRHFSIFPASHLRTFYVDLYWRINLRDLRDYKGNYFTAANDFAIMMPVLQMAGQRYEYLPELTYIYDAGTGYNNFQTKTQTQARNFKITKRRRRYPKIVHELQFQKRFKQKVNKKTQEQNNIH